MGLINDFIAIGQAQKIKNGQVANLSISQITGLITNMSDARRNLSEKDFKQVYNLYKQFKKCNNKMKMDLNGYYETATYIIKKFDAIAPYEKYSGGNELEFSFLMEEIRNNSDKKDICNQTTRSGPPTVRNTLLLVFLENIPFPTSLPNDAAPPLSYR